MIADPILAHIIEYFCYAGLVVIYHCIFAIVIVCYIDDQWKKTSVKDFAKIKKLHGYKK